MTADELVPTLARRLGLGDIRPEADGVYVLIFDDDLAVRCFLRGRERLILEGTVGALPADATRAAGQMKEALRINLARQREHPEILALPPEGRDILLYRPLPTEAIDEAGFADAVERFVTALEFWRARLAAEPPVAAAMPLQIFYP